MGRGLVESIRVAFYSAKAHVKAIELVAQLAALFRYNKQKP
jgi:hypothetical protein